jgi:ornithine cyclodeaminase
MLVLNESDLIKAVRIDELLQTIEDAFILQESEDFIMPERMHIKKGENVFLVMPGMAKDLYMTKIVSVFPGNIKMEKPSIYGTLQLNDGRTGEPLAFMNGAKITALRTGAVGAMGILYTTSPQSSTVGIIGLGIQGFHQALFSCAVRNIEKIFVFDPFISDVDTRIQDIKNLLPDIEIIKCSSAAELVDKSEIIITATNSHNPVIPDDSHLLAGKHFIGIGSYKPDMQEFPDVLFNQLDQIFVDTDHAKKESGDIAARLESSLINEDNVFTLGKLIEKKMKINEEKTTFFKSVGMALFDLMVAKKIYENAKEKNLGRIVDF